MLGLGRALGETIAVLLIISPRFDINFHILEAGGNSVSSLIALRYTEASGFGLSALMAAGLALFAHHPRRQLHGVVVRRQVPVRSEQRSMTSTIDSDRARSHRPRRGSTCTDAHAARAGAPSRPARPAARAAAVAQRRAIGKSRVATS